MSNEEIKIVLEELLEEQKQETLSNGEMIAILKQLLDKVSKMDNKFRQENEEEISKRLLDIQSVCNRSEHRVDRLKNVPGIAYTANTNRKKFAGYFKHWKAILAGFLFFLLFLALLIEYVAKCRELNRYKLLSKQYQLNDLKYRFINTSSNKIVKKILRLTDSLYKASPQGLVDSIIKAEKKQDKKRQ